MQNIQELLKAIGLEIPADKLDDFNKNFNANYKTVAEFDKRVQKLEGERDNYKAQFEKADTALKGFDGVDLEGMKTQIANYKKEAEDAKKDYESKIAERDFNDALKVELENVKFSSSYAKRAVENEIKAKGLKMEGGKILGLKDLLDAIKERDADAFAPEDGKAPAKFTAAKSTVGQNSKQYKSREEIMEIKDSEARQAAIAANLHLFN